MVFSHKGVSTVARMQCVSSWSKWESMLKELLLLQIYVGVRAAHSSSSQEELLSELSRPHRTLVPHLGESQRSSGVQYGWHFSCLRAEGSNENQRGNSCSSVFEAPLRPPVDKLAALS